MRLVLRVTLGIAMLAVALVALAPAALVDSIIAAHTEQRIRLSGASGFWWQGRGTLVFENETRIPIAWHVSPRRIAERTLAVDLFDLQRVPVGTLALRDGEAVISDVHAILPAKLLTSFDRSFGSVALGGTVTLDVPKLAMSNTRQSGVGRITWDRARVVAGGIVLNLGIVSMIAAPSDAGLSARLENDGGDVVLTGMLTNRGGRNQLALDVRPTSATPDAVRALLPTLGAPDSAGAVHVSWTGTR